MIKIPGCRSISRARRGAKRREEDGVFRAGWFRIRDGDAGAFAIHVVKQRFYAKFKVSQGGCSGGLVFRGCAV